VVKIGILRVNKARLYFYYGGHKMGTKITNFDLNKIINEFSRECDIVAGKDFSNAEVYSFVISWFNIKYQGNLEYTSSYSSVYFQNDEDATLFLLRHSR